MDAASQPRDDARMSAPAVSAPIAIAIGLYESI
jgi:hypothetical protein